MPMTTEYAKALANAGLSYLNAFERVVADLKSITSNPHIMGTNDILQAQIHGLVLTLDFARVELVAARQALTAESHRLEKITPHNARARRYNARRRAKAAAQEAPSSYAPQPAPYIPAAPTTPVAPPQPAGGAQPSAQGAQPIDYTALAESAAITPELAALKNLFE